MNEYSRRVLPPIAALNSFLAAARHGNFSRAGEQVGLTQSAVSRQIALLEDMLQVRLFERDGRRVRLSVEGQAYADMVGPALDRIRAATAQAITRHRRSELSIATLPSFGMRWLAPRLPRLSARHPDLIVNFSARSFPFDLAAEGFDAAIHFGLPDWPGAKHTLLFREQSVPVCSPEWLAFNPIVTPADLIGKPLLRQASRRSAWDQWFVAANVRDAPTVSGPSIEQFLMLAQAAAAGAGVALIPSFLIEPELTSGALVVPINQPLSGNEAYYLVEAHPIGRLPAVSHFRDWIVAEAADTA